MQRPETRSVFAGSPKLALCALSAGALLAGLHACAASGGGDRGGSGGGGGDSADSGGTSGSGKGGSSAKGGAGGTATSNGGATGKGGATASGGTAAGGAGTGGASGGKGGAAATGGSGGVANTGGAAADCTPVFTGLARDFTSIHPDFQPAPPADPAVMVGDGTGMVEKKLGADGRPVFAHAGAFIDGNGYPQVQSKTTFDQWFHNTDGVNKAESYSVLWEKRSITLSSFGSEEFFPMDGKGFGNIDLVDGTPTPQDMIEDPLHNGLLTYEVHGEILYQGGKSELMIIESDDDSWVFINGNLAIDNGGLHGFAASSVHLDAVAAELGIVAGQKYPVAIFFADRALTGSKLRFSSNVKFTNCAAILAKP